MTGRSGRTDGSGRPGSTDTDRSDPDPETENAITEATQTRSVRVLDSEPDGKAPRVKLLGIALAIAVVVAAFCAFKWYDVSQDRERESDLAAAGQEAEDRAVAMLGDMTTYSYKDKAFTWLDDYLVPEFAKSYSAGEQKTLQFVRQNKLVVSGTVVDSAHRVVSKNEVVVLAFIDQEFRKGKQVVGGNEQRARVNLEQTGGEWKISLVEILKSDNAR